MQKKYVYGPGIDEPILLDDLSNKYYYHMDGLGSVSELTDSSGAVVESYEYDVYGNTIIRDAQDAILNTSAIGNSYGFTGRRLDTKTGLYYYRARYYDPTLGRFLQTDPIGYYDSMNLYQYCINNSVNWVDPYGLLADNFFSGFFSGFFSWFSPGLPFGDGIKIPDWYKEDFYNARDAARDQSGSFGKEGEDCPDNSQDNGEKDDEDPGIPKPPDDPTQPPGEGWEWRGNGPPGSNKGNWYNPETGEKFHPDLDHPLPKGPHWGYKGPKGNYDIFPDGTIVKI